MITGSGFQKRGVANPLFTFDSIQRTQIRLELEENLRLAKINNSLLIIDKSSLFNKTFREILAESMDKKRRLPVYGNSWIYGYSSNAVFISLRMI